MFCSIDLIGAKLSESRFEEVYAELDIEMFFLEVIDVLLAIVP